MARALSTSGAATTPTNNGGVEAGGQAGPDEDVAPSPRNGHAEGVSEVALEDVSKVLRSGAVTARRCCDELGRVWYGQC